MADMTPSSIVDLQDPLPESNWFWRRVFVFAAMTVTFVFLFITIKQLALIAYMEPKQGIAALHDLCLRLLWLLFTLVLFYMVAPSAEQVIKMIQTASLLKNNVQIATRAVQQADGRTEVAQTAGQPPQPVVPPIESGPPATPPNQGSGGRKFWDDDAAQTPPPPSK